MKNLKTYWIAGVLLLFLSTTVSSQVQADKKAAEIKKLETALNAAKAKVALNEKQIAVADSLVETGIKMVDESKTELKSLEADKKKLDKEYAANKKPLEKSVTSKDKEEATSAKNDLKNLDIKYKADAKALDTKIKDATKKSTTGTANINKGKMSKKTASDALKMSQSALDNAQAKYDGATGTGDENAKDKKKKK